jgi:hypothetical protein
MMPLRYADCHFDIAATLFFHAATLTFRADTPCHLPILCAATHLAAFTAYYAAITPPLHFRCFCQPFSFYISIIDDFFV